MEMNEVRSLQKLRVFKSEEMNFHLMRAISCMTEKGAEIGECLYAASRIKNGDPQSWVESFSQIAAHVENLAHAELDKQCTINAKENYLRASNYYRAAEYFASPHDAEFHDLWAKSRATFQSACTLMDCYAESILIPFEGKGMPGYFFRSKGAPGKHPTLMIHGGADTSGEELYFWCGAAAVRRGYNAVIFEGPGSRGAVHLYPELVERPDFEVPVRTAVDYVLNRQEVDAERLALIGFSAGGYRCASAVAFEHRIQAVILSAPMRNINQLVTSAFGNILSLVPHKLIDSIAPLKMRQDPMLRVFLEYAFWKNGFNKVSELLESTKAYTLEGLEKNITCAVLALVGQGEGKQTLAQAQQFYENVASKRKTLRIFTFQDGADDHCQINNHTLRNQVVFDWLDDVFKAA